MVYRERKGVLLTSEEYFSLNCYNLIGGMAEWSMATVLKTVRPVFGSRGFESHSLRHVKIAVRSRGAATRTTQKVMQKRLYVGRATQSLYVPARDHVAQPRVRHIVYSQSVMLRLRTTPWWFFNIVYGEIWSGMKRNVL